MKRSREIGNSIDFSTWSLLLLDIHGETQIHLQLNVSFLGSGLWIWRGVRPLLSAFALRNSTGFLFKPECILMWLTTCHKRWLTLYTAFLSTCKLNVCRAYRSVNKSGSSVVRKQGCVGTQTFYPPRFILYSIHKIYVNFLSTKNSILLLNEYKKNRVQRELSLVLMLILTLL